jgi:hypothetical protein
MISVLSGLVPLLFLVYINDIGDKLLSLSRLFADDTSLGYASQDEATGTYPWGTPADTYEDDESLFTTFWCLQYR